MQEYVGGYEDWLRQRPASTEATGIKAASGRTHSEPTAPKKLSFNEQRELNDLPPTIERLEAEQRQLTARMDAPDFYKEPSDSIARMLARLDELKGSLIQAYARWDELDSRAKS